MAVGLARKGLKRNEKYLVSGRCQPLIRVIDNTTFAGSRSPKAAMQTTPEEERKMK